ncbi:unnamed protein product [Knipowitschia caucasica]|uniref:Uncharacterized protein n=1 Tax=Knipowitschia caucasica TaxID=637954 RepID=A0AAV2L369_KNICA
MLSAVISFNFDFLFFFQDLIFLRSDFQTIPQTLEHSADKTRSDDCGEKRKPEASALNVKQNLRLLKFV